MTLLRVEQILLLSAIATMPLYLWSSGLPQIAHILVVASCLVRMLRGKPLFPYNTVFKILFILLAWVTVRQLVYGISSQNFFALFAPVYLLFNSLFLSLIYFMIMSSGASGNYSRVSFAVSIAALIAVASVFITGFSLSGTAQDYNRSVGSFNNPNQLGFYGVCLGGFASILYQNGKIKLRVFMILICSGVFLTVLSLSKAAMISYLAYGFVFIRGRQSIYLTFFAISLFIVVQQFDLSSYHFISRLSSIGSDSDDSLAARGYGLVGEMGFNLIWGFGEGYYQSISGDEIHSTLANLFISYGFVGLGLFISFQGAIFLSSLRRTRSVAVSVFIFFPYILYGITHNGFRFSSIWLLFGLVAFLDGLPSRSASLRYSPLSFSK